MVIGALLLLLILPVGGLVVISLGGYIGIRARRARAQGTPAQEGQLLIDATPSPPTVGKFLGLTPSYGLSAAFTVVGILMFIGGIALFSAPNAPDDRIAAPAAPAALPTTAPPSSEPAFAAPPGDSTPASLQPQPIQAPEDKAAQPVAPQPTTPKPAARPRPTSPEPVATRPNSPPPVATAPASPPPAASNGSAVYYKNCDEARAAGAAPLHRGQPGYRAGLDRDNDGTACDIER